MFYFSSLASPGIYSGKSHLSSHSSKVEPLAFTGLFNRFPVDQDLLSRSAALIGIQLPGSTSQTEDEFLRTQPSDETKKFAVSADHENTYTFSVADDEASLFFIQCKKADVSASEFHSIAKRQMSPGYYIFDSLRNGRQIRRDSAHVNALLDAFLKAYRP